LDERLGFGDLCPTVNQLKARQEYPASAGDACQEYEPALTPDAGKLEDVSTLLQQAMEKVVALPEDEQNMVAAQILAVIADEGAWKEQMASKRDVIRRMAREALEEDAAGQTLPLDDLL
jgi:hypothetical protein